MPSDQADLLGRRFALALDRLRLEPRLRAEILQALCDAFQATPPRPHPAASSAPTLVEELTTYSALLDGTTMPGGPPPAAASRRDLDPTHLAVELTTQRDDDVTPLPRLDDPREGPRYEHDSLLGVGGMSEVWRARDHALHRDVAVKIPRQERMYNRRWVERFAREAVATAQLQHPGIVPIYDVGRLPDGRPFFVMKEIGGRTLTSIIDAYHDPAASAPDGREWSLWRLVEVFQRVCATMAYAHEKGVIHLDLKPDNILVGEFGEVLVVDWGLARTHEEPDPPAPAALEADPEEVTQDTPNTRIVTGTPRYMAPERFEETGVGVRPTMDVYGLGAILYQICAGQPPFTGRSVFEVMIAATLQPTPPLPNNIPAPLGALCQRALSKDPAHRFPTARELAEEVQAWLEDARRRDQALEMVQEALSHDPAQHGHALRARAAALREQARVALRHVRPFDPIEAKGPGWALEDQAAELELQAELNDTVYLQSLRSSLSLVPDLPEAHRLLADFYQRQHVQAEARQDAAASARHEILLRAHDRGRYAAYLEGNGALTVVTDPPGATARLFRYEQQQRRATPTLERSLGVTPIVAVPVPRGSYLLELSLPGRAVVRYPLLIERGQHWDGVPPGGTDALPIPLPRDGALGDGDVYIPPGWCWAGGDELAAGSLPRRRVWIDGFVIRRHPITNQEYLRFLNALVRGGDEAQALRHQPRAAPARVGELGAPAYARLPDGSFAVTVDAEGDAWDPRWPVMCVDWSGALAFARWEADRSGLPWRLPRELEWEKAARGADGRAFPWGEHLDPTWCCMRESHPGRPLPAPVDAYPGDVSPYGVRGMAGNVRDWCDDAYEPGGPPVDPQGRVGGGPSDPQDLDTPRVNRGGYFDANAAGVRCATRDWVVPAARGVITGFRVARGWEG